ncbi:hypothetical protein VIS19158_08413 [Vibrio scophthalmi LMG 19158]|uniref:Uncharacterized protein n=1 Tax=Vibrio scophthalmi LMG 19158 TaxID=870967 RepID=F9RU21_9VIBR|nr:hypothetical protein VIS19158_08413 [Vibrio scophthalmi LMG 19158]
MIRICQIALETAGGAKSGFGRHWRFFTEKVNKQPRYECALYTAICQTGMGVVVLKNHAHYTETKRFVAAF